MTYEVVLDFEVDEEQSEWISILKEAIEDGVRSVNGSVKIGFIKEYHLNDYGQEM